MYKKTLPTLLCAAALTACTALGNAPQKMSGQPVNITGDFMRR